MSTSTIRSMPPIRETVTLRALAAMVLFWLSRRMRSLGVRLARRSVSMARVARESDAVLEFYGDAGAPEGALYIDGQLVGLLDGVQRL